jgi:hypothetical protein
VDQDSRGPRAGGEGHLQVPQSQLEHRSGTFKVLPTAPALARASVLGLTWAGSVTVTATRAL